MDTLLTVSTVKMNEWHTVHLILYNDYVRHQSLFKYVRNFEIVK